MAPDAARRQAVFGGSDGLTLAIGFIAGMSGQPAHAIVRAAVAAGIAELVGMTAGSWLSDSEAGFRPAAANGLAALAACVVPVLPYLAGPGARWAELAASLVLVISVGALIACLREERGVKGLVQTFGVLSLAALACWASSLI